MKSYVKQALVFAIAASTAHASHSAENIGEALKESTATGDFRLRYEDVDNSTTTSDGLTLRTRIGVKTGSVSGFSAVAEVEDVRDIAGVDDEGGLIADPEVTEVDQAFIQYKSDMVTAKVGRQVVALGNQRYIGHVGWRQDRQTFDAATIKITPAKGASIDVGYMVKRNRIFGEAGDQESSDVFVNGSYVTPIGKLLGYAYLLDQDNGAESDTYGLSLNGSTKGDTSFLYHVEYATQDIDTRNGDSPDYMFAELGVKTAGVTAKLGYEALGFDGTSSFTTPLATLYKFNGWADIFLGPTATGTLNGGLEDTYLTVSGKLAGLGLTAVYHDYAAETGGADYGSEWGFNVGKSFKAGYSLALRYTSYESDGFAADTDKLWIWAGYKF